MLWKSSRNMLIFFNISRILLILSVTNNLFFNQRGICLICKMKIFSRIETLKDIFWHKKMMFHKENYWNSHLWLKHMIILKFVSHHMFLTVCTIHFISYVMNNWFPWKITFLSVLLDARGMRQEVALNVKKGIEAKSYEGVSTIKNLKQ